MNESMNDLINDKAVYRRAMAAQGLFIGEMGKITCKTYNSPFTGGEKGISCILFYLLYLQGTCL